MARPSAARALASTMRHLPVTNAQTRENKSLSDIPLAVIHSSKFDEYGTHFESEEEREQFRAESFAYWHYLLGLSTGSHELVRIEGANHLTMVRDDAYWPQAVEAILRVVADVRSASGSSGTE